MKKIRIATCLASISLLSLVHPASFGWQTGGASLVKVRLKNTAATARTITIVTYQPSDPLNGTEQVTMPTGAEKALAYQEGTAIYLATPAQIRLVMSGKRLDQAKPFLLFKRSDAGKTFRY